jgi:hypothetical protein
MLRQRIYGLALGYEELNDHDTLRKDLLWQTARERTEELASCSTLCRLENRAGRKEAWLMHQVRLALLVKALRKRWPKVKIILRADSGFCRWKMLRWCERAGIHYIVGLAKNERLNALSAKLHRRAQRKHQKTGRKVRLFTQLKYKAKTWDKKRRVIAKAEHSDRGANPRYVVTNLEGGSERLYDDIYCARGEMENRIKEQQLGLFSDRTSCHAWWANQFPALAFVGRLRALRSTASAWFKRH